MQVDVYKKGQRRNPERVPHDQARWIQAYTWGGPERMGPRPPPWVPLLKSYGSSILSTSLGSKTLNNTSSLGLGGTKI